jgi:curved DNA-binding protein
MAPAQDFYEVLGVPRTADQKEIQRAYRKLARTYHPDVNKDPGAEDRFKQISEAYDVLSDPDTRRRYDTFGRDFRQVPEGMDPDTWARARRAGPGAGARRGAEAGRTRTAGGVDVDLEDILGDIFGGGFGAGFGRQAGGWGPVPGADQEAELVLTVEEAYRGGRRSVTLSGDSEGARSYEVTIPPGVTDGQRIRLAGQGGHGGDGGAPGDLYLVVRIAPHPRYRLEGRDLYVDLALAPWEAALGASVPVDTPDGEAKVTVPAGTSSGRRLRLRGRGLPNPRGTPGDLYAEARILVPARPGDEERRLFQRLSEVSDFDPRRSR